MCRQLLAEAVLLGSLRLVVSFEVEASRLDTVEVFRCGEGLCRGLAVVEVETCQVEEVFEDRDRRNVVEEVFFLFLVLFRKACRHNVVAVCSHGHGRRCCEADAAHDGRYIHRSDHVAEVFVLARWRKEVVLLVRDACRMAVIYPESHIHFEGQSRPDHQQALGAVFCPLSAFVYQTHENLPWLAGLLVLPVKELL